VLGLLGGVRLERRLGVRGAARRLGERDDRVAVLAAVVGQFVAGQRPLRPARVERVVQDVPALAHGVQLSEKPHRRIPLSATNRPEARCYLAAGAHPRRADRRADVSRRHRLVERRADPDGPDARPTGADRVLRRLPCQLVADAPYIKAWAAKYPGLRVISVHAPGYPPSHDVDVVRAALERLDIEHPVVVDNQMAIWRLYGNKGWPGRYLWDKRHRLFEIHYGEGAYAETERAIQELLKLDETWSSRSGPRTSRRRCWSCPTPEQEGAYSGPYEAGAVWAVLEGDGAIRVNGEQYDVAYTGAHQLVEHGVSTEGVVELEIGAGVTCHATVFTPGLAP
jgi:hypothetical protein